MATLFETVQELEKSQKEVQADIERFLEGADYTQNTLQLIHNELQGKGLLHKYDIKDFLEQDNINKVNTTINLANKEKLRYHINEGWILSSKENVRIYNPQHLKEDVGFLSAFTLTGIVGGTLMNVAHNREPNIMYLQTGLAAGLILGAGITAAVTDKPIITKNPHINVAESIRTQKEQLQKIYVRPELLTNKGQQIQPIKFEEAYQRTSNNAPVTERISQHQ